MYTSLTLVAALSLGAPALKDKEPLGTGPGYLGIMFQKDGDGLLVTEIKPDGPAGKAGLKEGDVIFKINDADMKDADTSDLIKLVGGMRPGTLVAITIQRGNMRTIVNVKLAPRPADFAQPVRLPKIDD